MVVAGMDALSESCENILTRRANQRHYSIIAPNRMTSRRAGVMTASIARNRELSLSKIEQPQKPAGSAGGFFYAWILTAPIDIAGCGAGDHEARTSKNYR